MKLALWRLVLSPLTSLRALHLQRRSTDGLSFDAAWRQARMLRAPDEMVYRVYGHQRISPIDGNHKSVHPRPDDENTPIGP